VLFDLIPAWMPDCPHLRVVRFANLCGRVSVFSTHSPALAHLTTLFRL
jgi:hypothetical protein